MTLKDINPPKVIEHVRQQMADDVQLSPSFAAAIDMLIMLCVLDFVALIEHAQEALEKDVDQIELHYVKKIPESNRK